MSLLLLLTHPQDGFQGELDDVAVYSTALSATQIQHHYQTSIDAPGSYPATVTADSPVGFWRFEEEAGIAHDSAGVHTGTYAQSQGIVLRQDGAYVSSPNRVTLYFREVTGPTITMLDLDDGSWTMEKLDSLGHQPELGSVTTLSLDAILPESVIQVVSTAGFPSFGSIEIGNQMVTYSGKTGTTFTGCVGGAGTYSSGTNVVVSTYTARTQDDLDDVPQSALDDNSQIDLERLPDFAVSSWIKVDLFWDALHSQLDVADAIGNKHSFSDFTLRANHDYILFADVVETGVRARIYELDTNISSPTASTTETVQNTLVLDTTCVVDDSFIHRRRGRLGWYAQFADGDALLYSIRPRGMNFAEWRSHPFRSVTPVKGAQLFVSGSNTRQLFNGWVPGPLGGSIQPETSKSNSGKAFVIENDGSKPLQGIATHPLFYDDFPNTVISFDVWIPKLDQAAALTCFLFGDNDRIVPLRDLNIAPNNWQRVTIRLGDLDTVQPGPYSLVILQSLARVPTTWYIDNASIEQKVLDWEGRSRANNAWNELPEDWIDFGATTNNLQGGTLFPHKERDLQVRGKAIQQDAYIESVRIVPEYAETGRFIWTDAEVTPPAPPVAKIGIALSHLNGSINNLVTTLTVTDAGIFPNSGLVLIEDEYIRYTGKTATTFTGCTRGYHGSLAASHTSGKQVLTSPVFLTAEASTTSTYATSYEWEFGDGKFGYGLNLTHAYDARGIYRIGLVVTDSHGQRNQVTQTITF